MSFGRELIQIAEEALAVAKGESEPAGVLVPEAADAAANFNVSTKPDLNSPDELAANAAAVRGETAASGQSSSRCSRRR